MYRRTITPSAPTAPREMGLCEYCSTPCVRGKDGTFACAGACPTKRAPEPEPTGVWTTREVRNFVRGEFRANGAIV